MAHKEQCSVATLEVMKRQLLVKMRSSSASCGRTQGAAAWHRQETDYFPGSTARQVLQPKKLSQEQQREGVSRTPGLLMR